MKHVHGPLNQVSKLELLRSWLIFSSGKFLDYSVVMPIWSFWWAIVAFLLVLYQVLDAWYSEIQLLTLAA